MHKFHDQAKIVVKHNSTENEAVPSVAKPTSLYKHGINSDQSDWR